MSELDEVSRQIGRLTALVETNNSQTAALFRKFDENNRELIEHAGVIKHLGEAFVAHRAEDQLMHKMVSEIKADIDAAKNKGKGLTVGLALFGGGGGAAGIISALHGLFSGGSTPGH